MKSDQQIKLLHLQLLYLESLLETNQKSEYENNNFFFTFRKFKISTRRKIKF